MSSHKIPKFIQMLYEIVADPTINNIHWVPKKRKDDPDKFIVHDPDDLQNDIKRISNTQKIKSFVRQLHFYGFRKIGGTRHKEWVYFNKHFTVLGDELIDIRRNTHRNFDGIIARVEALENKPDLLARIEALENKPSTDLLARIEALENKPSTDLLARIEALENKLSTDLLARIEALEKNKALIKRIEALEKKNTELEKTIENMSYDNIMLYLQDDNILPIDEDDLTKMNFKLDPNLPI